jgi:hypothetical protein
VTTWRPLVAGGVRASSWALACACACVVVACAGEPSTSSTALPSGPRPIPASASPPGEGSPSGQAPASARATASAPAAGSSLVVPSASRVEPVTRVPDVERLCSRSADCMLETVATCCGECLTFPYVAKNARLVGLDHALAKRGCEREDWDCETVKCPIIPKGCKATVTCEKGLCEAHAEGCP